MAEYDPRDFAGLPGLAPPTPTPKWAQILNVIGGGLRDLGGYSGGGHMQFAAGQNEYDRERFNREWADYSNRQWQGVLADKLQSGGGLSSIADTLLSYARNGGDLSSVMPLINVATMRTKAQEQERALSAFQPGDWSPSSLPAMTPNVMRAGSNAAPAQSAFAAAPTGGTGNVGLLDNMAPGPASIIRAMAGGGMVPQAYQEALKLSQGPEYAVQQDPYGSSMPGVGQVNTRTGQISGFQAANGEQTTAIRDAEAIGLKRGTPEFADYIRRRTLPQESGGSDQSMAGWNLYADPKAGTQFRFNARTGESMGLDGKPYTPQSMTLLSQDPYATFGAASGRAGGNVSGAAAANLPQAEVAYQNAMRVISDFDLPDVKAQAPYALGVGGILPPVPGVNTDFIMRARQLQGMSFLQAYQSLRGGGAISEVEGAKATEAQARLNRAQTVGEYYSALHDAKALMTEAWSAQQKIAGRGATAPQMRDAPAPTTAKQGGGGGVQVGTRARNAQGQELQWNGASWAAVR